MAHILFAVNPNIAIPNWIFPPLKLHLYQTHSVLYLRRSLLSLYLLTTVFPLRLSLPTTQYLLTSLSLYWSRNCCSTLWLQVCLSSSKTNKNPSKLFFHLPADLTTPPPKPSTQANHSILGTKFYFIFLLFLSFLVGLVQFYSMSVLSFEVSVLQKIAAALRIFWDH